jgi:predicted DNA-binding transcriptional regulator YafY
MSSPTARLLSVLSLLQTGRDWSGAQLAARLEVSGRTVRRDVDQLRGLGYRIDATLGPDGGYRLAAGSDLPPLLFDDDQAVAVAIALQTASAVGGEIEEAALRALATIRRVMPSHLRHRMDALEIAAVPVRPGDATPPATRMDVLVSLANTIRARRVLRFDFSAGSAPEAAGDRDPSANLRRVEPHHLVAAQGSWYLVAWDLDRDDWRLFRVDRITPRVPDGALFDRREVPGGDVRTFVSARFRGRDVDAWACRGTVIVHLPAHDVLPFAGDAVVQELDGDRCVLEVGSWSWGSLAASLGRFEVPLEVVDPPELVDAFAALAARYAATARAGISPGGR